MSKEYYMKLASRGAISEEQLMYHLERAYRMSPSSFTMEEVDYLEKYKQQRNQTLEKDMDVEERKLLEGLNQFVSGVVEGFTTLGWADEPGTQGQALANKIGHFIGFAPDIIAGVMTGGLSASATALKLSGKAAVKAGAKKATARKLDDAAVKMQDRHMSFQEKVASYQGAAGAWGKENIPLLVTEGKDGALALRSVPMRAADYLIGQSKAKLGGIGSMAGKFFGKHQGVAEDILIDKGVHLGIALGVSSIWEGPKAASEAAVHGTVAGMVFGGIGNYMNIGKMLSSKDILVRKNGETMLRSVAGKISKESGEALDFLVKGGTGAAYTGTMAKDAPLPDQVYELLLGFFFGASSRPWAEIQRTKLVWENNNEIFSSMEPYVKINPETGKPKWDETTGGKVITRKLTPEERVEKEKLEKIRSDWKTAEGEKINPETGKPKWMEMTKARWERLQELRKIDKGEVTRIEGDPDRIGALPLDITTFDFYKDAHPLVKKELRDYEGRILHQVYKRNTRQFEKVLKELYKRAEEEAADGNLKPLESLNEMDFSAKLAQVRNEYIAAQKRFAKQEKADGKKFENDSLKAKVEIDKDGEVNFSFDIGKRVWDRKSIEESSNILFVYPDNLSGDLVHQATEQAKGTDNSSPIRADKSKTERWTDKTFKQNKKSIDKDIAEIEKKFKEGEYEVIDIMSTFEGLAENAPNTAKYLAKRLAYLQTEYRNKTFKVTSGGAMGADSLFGKYLEKYGIEVDHLYIAGGKQPPLGNKKIDPEMAQEADVHLSKANETLGRTFPSKKEGVNNYLRRNYFQVQNAEQVIAITNFLPDGNPRGGTAWAIQMGIDLGKDVYVYDVYSKRWVEWNKDTGVWEIMKSIPNLTRSFAAIGSQEVGRGKDSKLSKEQAKDYIDAEKIIPELLEYNLGNPIEPFPELTDIDIARKRALNNKDHEDDTVSYNNKPADYDVNVGEQFIPEAGDKHIKEMLQDVSLETRYNTEKELQRILLRSKDKEEFLEETLPYFDDIISSKRHSKDKVKTKLIKYFNWHKGRMPEDTRALSILLKMNEKGFVEIDTIDILPTPKTNRKGDRNLVESRPENVTNVEYQGKMSFYIDYMDIRTSGDSKIPGWRRVDFENFDINDSANIANIFALNNIEKRLSSPEMLKEIFPHDVNAQGKSILKGAYIFSIPKDKKTIEIRRHPYQHQDNTRPDFINIADFNKIIYKDLIHTYRSNGGRVKDYFSFLQSLKRTPFGQWVFKFRTNGDVIDYKREKGAYDSYYNHKVHGMGSKIVSNMIYELQEWGFLPKDLRTIKPEEYTKALQRYYDEIPIEDIFSWNKYRGLWRGNGTQLDNKRTLEALGIKGNTLKAIAVEDIKTSDIEHVAERVGKTPDEVRSVLNEIAKTDGGVNAHSSLMDYLGKETVTPGRSFVKPVVMKYGEYGGLGLILGKAGLFRGSPELDAFMEMRGVQLIFRRSALKGKPGVKVGKLEVENGKYKELVESEIFDIEPKDIRIIQSEIEKTRQESTRNISMHKGVFNKINHFFDGDFNAAWDKVIDKQLNPDPDFDSSISPVTYTRGGLVQNYIQKNNITSNTLDRISTSKIQDIVTNHSYSDAMRDLVKAVLRYDKNALDLNNTIQSEIDPNTAKHKELVQDVLDKSDYNPMIINSDVVLPYLRATVKNYIFKRIQRPIATKGFDFTRLHSAEEILIDKIPELFTDSSNDKFYANEGHRKDPVDLRRIIRKDGKDTGEVRVEERTLEYALALYKGELRDKKGERIKIGKKQKKLLEEDLHYLFTRAPQGGNSGVKSLRFAGFSGIPGRGIIANEKNYRDINGADVDGDAVSGYQSIDWALKKGFKNPKINDELVGREVLDFSLFDSGKPSHSADILFEKRAMGWKEIIPHDFTDLTSLGGFYKNPKGDFNVYPTTSIKNAKVSTIFHPWWRIQQGRASQIAKDNIGIATDNNIYFQHLASSIIRNGSKAYDLLDNHGSGFNKGWTIDLRKQPDNGPLSKLSKNEWKDYVFDYLVRAMHHSLASAVDGSKNWINRRQAALNSEIFHLAFDIRNAQGDILSPGRDIPESLASLMGRQKQGIDKIYPLLRVEDKPDRSYSEARRRHDAGEREKNGRRLKHSEKADYKTYREPFNFYNKDDMAVFQTMLRDAAANKEEFYYLNLRRSDEKIPAVKIIGKINDANIESNKIQRFEKIDKETEKELIARAERHTSPMPNTIILDVKGEKEGIIVTYIKPGLNYQRGENIVFESKIQDIQSFGTMVDASSTLYSLRDLNSTLSQKFNKKQYTAELMNWDASRYLDAWKDHKQDISTDFYTKMAETIAYNTEKGFGLDFEPINNIPKSVERIVSDALDLLKDSHVNNVWFGEMVKEGLVQEHPLLYGLSRNVSDTTSSRKKLILEILKKDALKNTTLHKGITSLNNYVAMIKTMEVLREKLIRASRDLPLTGEQIDSKIAEIMTTAWEIKFKSQIERKVQSESGIAVDDAMLNNYVIDYKRNQLDNFYSDKQGNITRDKNFPHLGLSIFSDYVNRGHTTVSEYIKPDYAKKGVFPESYEIALDRVSAQKKFIYPELDAILEQLFDSAMISTIPAGNRFKNKQMFSLLQKYQTKDIDPNKPGELVRRDLLKRRDIEVQEGRTREELLKDLEFEQLLKELDVSAIDMHTFVSNKLLNMDKILREEGPEAFKKYIGGLVSSGGKTITLVDQVLRNSQIPVFFSGEQINRLTSINPDNLRMFYDIAYDLMKDMNSKNLNEQILVTSDNNASSVNTPIAKSVIKEHMKAKHLEESKKVNPKSIEEPIVLDKSIKIKNVDAMDKRLMSRDGKKRAAFISSNGEIFISKEAISFSFKNKGWKKPTISGVKPIPFDFSTEKQYREFIVYHELAHFINERWPGEWNAFYENRINRIALKSLEHSGELNKSQKEILENENFLDWKNKNPEDYDILTITDYGELSLEYDVRQNTSNTETLVRIRELEEGKKILDDIIINEIKKKIENPEQKGDPLEFVEDLINKKDLPPTEAYDEVFEIFSGKKPEEIPGIELGKKAKEVKEKIKPIDDPLSEIEKIKKSALTSLEAILDLTPIEWLKTRFPKQKWTDKDVSKALKGEKVVKVETGRVFQGKKQYVLEALNPNELKALKDIFKDKEETEKIKKSVKVITSEKKTNKIIEKAEEVLKTPNEEVSIDKSELTLNEVLDAMDKADFGGKLDLEGVPKEKKDKKTKEIPLEEAPVLAARKAMDRLKEIAKKLDNKITEQIIDKPAVKDLPPVKEKEPVRKTRKELEEELIKEQSDAIDEVFPMAAKQKIEIEKEKEKKKEVPIENRLDDVDVHKINEAILDAIEALKKKTEEGVDISAEDLRSIQRVIDENIDRQLHEGHSMMLLDGTPETLQRYTDIAKEKGIEYATGKYVEELTHSIDLLNEMDVRTKVDVIDQLQPTLEILTMDTFKKERGKHSIDTETPDYYTKSMKHNIDRLVDFLTENPSMIPLFQHEFTAVSGQLGTTGKELLGKRIRNMTGDDVRWFYRYMKDQYDPGLSLVDRIKLYANVMGKNFNDPDLGMETPEEALKNYKGLKGLYHIMFTRRVGEILKRHELKRFEERNVAVEGLDGAPSLKSLIRPTSTLELIRQYVDYGKTINTATSVMLKDLYDSSFNFLQTQDKNLGKELNDIYQNAIRVREYANVELKRDGLTKEAVDWYTTQKEVADIFFNQLGDKKFEIKDPEAKKGETVSKTAREIADIINEKLTDYLDTVRKTFITKGMNPVKDKEGNIIEWELDSIFMGDMIRTDGWLSERSMANLLTPQRLKGGSTSEQLNRAPGFNQLKFLQFHYNLLEQARRKYGKGFRTNTNAIKERNDQIEYFQNNIKDFFIDVILDKDGRASFYFPHNGMWDIRQNQEAVSRALERNINRYKASLINGDEKLPGMIKYFMKRGLEGYETFDKAVDKAVLEKRRLYTQSRMMEDSTNGIESISVYNNIAYSKSFGETGQYMSGSLHSRAPDFLPFYRIDKRAIDVYTTNIVKNYFDNIIGLKSQMLLDAFERKNALGEHTMNWSGFIRDSLINMLGYNTFREIGIHGITKKENAYLLDILNEYEKLESDPKRLHDSYSLYQLVTQVSKGKPKELWQERFLGKLDDFVAPPQEWFFTLPSNLKGSELKNAIMDYKIKQMKELAKPENINKIKRYGTVYNYFSEEGFVNRIEWFEKKLGKKFFNKRLTRINHKGEEIEITGNERRNRIANIAKSWSNLEGKYQLLSLLAHPKTLLTNIYGGTQNTFSDNGWEIFRQATSESFLIDKVFKGVEFKWKNPDTGKTESVKIRSMEDIQKWVDSLGILDSMFLQEVGINKDLNRRDSKAFWETFVKRFTERLEKEPNKEDPKTYDRLHKATLRELAKEKGIADELIRKGSSFMQWSERLLRRTSFLASYLMARRNLHPLTKELPFDSPVLIEFAKRGVEASQFMYHSAFRTNYSNTALGRIMTRFHPYAWNSISRRIKLYKGAYYVNWANNVSATEKAQRQMTVDLMAFALGTVFTSSLFEYALSPPMSWMQDSAQLFFGDKKTRERAFFSQWPHPALSILQPVTPPMARFVLQPVNALLNDDLGSLWGYSLATWLPFGRMGRDVYRSVQSPAMTVDFMTGLPLHRIHTKRRAYLDRIEAENNEIPEE